jgi:hypothetical protein
VTEWKPTRDECPTHLFLDTGVTYPKNSKSAADITTPRLAITNDDLPTKGRVQDKPKPQQAHIRIQGDQGPPSQRPKVTFAWFLAEGDGKTPMYSIQRIVKTCAMLPAHRTDYLPAPI